MTDTQVLRQALRDRERYAPAEAAVLAAFEAGLARRRRIRQAARVVVVGAACAAVAAGAVLGLTPRSAAPATPAVTTGATTPSPRPVPPPPADPALPFTAGWLPAGYGLDAWRSGGGVGSAQYVGTGDFEAVSVEVSAAVPDVPDGATVAPTTVAGRPGAIRTFDGGAENQFVWQRADGRWVRVGGRAPQVTIATLRRVAENVTATPTPLSTTWSLRALPDGYQAQWQGQERAGAGALLVCPAAEPVDTATDCASVTVRDGVAPATTTLLIGTGTSSKTVSEVPVDRIQVVDGVTTRASEDGTVVYAQLDEGHWVDVTSSTGDPALARRLASLAVLH